MNLTQRSKRTLIAGLLLSGMISVIMGIGAEWAVRPTFEVVFATLAGTTAVVTFVEAVERDRRKRSAD